MDQSTVHQLITDGLQEVMDDNLLKNHLSTGKPLRIYWGTAPTGIPSIGYFLPMKKIADFIKAGCEVTILFADLHAFLDSMKSPLDIVKLRTKVYEDIIKGTLDALNVDHSKIKFVIGSSFQLSSEYQMDLLRLGNVLTIHDAQKAGTEVVKQNKNPLVTSLLYPLMQALDEEHLNIDAQFGGIDQRKIFALSIDYLPRIGYAKRIHLMNPIIPALSSVATNGEVVKMSSSDINGKISLLDSPNDIKKKVSKTYCKDGDTNDNTLLVLLEKLLFPILINLKKTFVINRPEQYGGTIEYATFNDVKNDFANNKLSAIDLKMGITILLVWLTNPIRNRFNSDEGQMLLKKAYP